MVRKDSGPITETEFAGKPIWADDRTYEKQQFLRLPS
jgi:hypothetical protein